LNQLGYDVIGRKNWSHEPKQVLFGDIDDEQWAAFDSVYAGYGHSAVVTVDGRVWMWGWGEDGQLGTCNENSSQSPVKLSTLSTHRVLSLALGRSHSLCIVRPDDMSDIAEESEYVVEASKPPQFDDRVKEGSLDDATGVAAPLADFGSVSSPSAAAVPVTETQADIELTCGVHPRVALDAQAATLETSVSDPSPGLLSSLVPFPASPSVMPQAELGFIPSDDALVVEEEPARVVVVATPLSTKPVGALVPKDDLALAENRTQMSSSPVPPLPFDDARVSGIPPLVATSAWSDPDGETVAASSMYSDCLESGFWYRYQHWNAVHLPLCECGRGSGYGSATLASSSQRHQASLESSSKPRKKLPRSQSTADVSTDNSVRHHRSDRSESVSRRPIKSASQPGVGLPAVKGASDDHKPVSSRHPPPRPSQSAVPLPAVAKRTQPVTRRK
jgi:hypothetical protein